MDKSHEIALFREGERQKGDLYARIDLLTLGEAQSSIAAQAHAKGVTVAQLVLDLKMRATQNKRKHEIDLGMLPLPVRIPAAPPERLEVVEMCPLLECTAYWRENCPRGPTI
jgi:hypothetical protein